MIRPVLLILVPALAFPVLSYRTIVGDSTANAALASAEAVVPPVPETPVFDMRDEETYSVILERPLFSPSRRPAGPAQATTSATTASDGLTLLGVASGAGRTVALIRSGTGTPAIKAQPGEEVAGWQLVEVAAGTVVLERQGGRLHLDLPFKAPGPVAASVIGSSEPTLEAESESESEPAEAEAVPEEADTPPEN